MLNNEVPIKHEIYFFFFFNIKQRDPHTALLEIFKVEQTLSECSKIHVETHK